MPEIELPDTDELEEKRRKRFTKRVALTTAIFAVLLAITSLGGNNSMKDMLLAQQQSSDQWAFYQSKVIRENLYKMERTLLETDLLKRESSMKPDVRNRYQSMLKQMDHEEKRYATEKKKIEEEAKNLERIRDLNMKRDPYFDYAEVLLQISIVMASVSILATSRIVFSFALIAAVLGSLLMLNGFLLVLSIPLFQ
jgi:hypothetical protein